VKVRKGSLPLSPQHGGESPRSRATGSRGDERPSAMREGRARGAVGGVFAIRKATQRDRRSQADDRLVAAFIRTIDFDLRWTIEVARRSPSCARARVPV